jgi:hypothetical protein
MRPPIERIVYTTAEGNPGVFQLGRGVSEIRETEENGEFSTIPWVEVWDRSSLLFRCNQHKLEHIIYQRPA